VKAAAREAAEAPAQYAQPAPHGGDRRTSGADAHRTESQGILAERPADPEPDESEGTEARVEVDEQEAKTALQAGLERAAQGKENAIYAHGDHIPDTGTSEAEQALAQTAYQAARAAVVAEADETYQAAKFAAEASIHHLCAVANLIKTCCLEGAAHDLVTDLGPERFTEWKERENRVKGGRKQSESRVKGE
jgi:hypothetical protein